MQGSLLFELHTVDSIKSTNTTVKELAKNGAPEGYVLVALEQTNGRGRMNRVFFSPKGTGLYCSILLRPSIILPPAALTCLSAVAVSETIDAFGVENRIKWVNDIYVCGKKAVGILTEGAFAPDGSYQYAVVGIGVNLFEPQDGFPESIASVATSVFSSEQDETIRKSFLQKLLKRIKYYYEQLPDMPFLDAYREKQMIYGRSILFTEPDGIKRGIAIGIDDMFRLLVKTNDGSVHAVERGEVSVL